jgi:electron transport complex protein RnfB
MKRTAVALVDEARCIGCARCILACPVDAIAGAEGYMHVVIGDYCTGCELCLPPCPVDCIDMVPTAVPWTEAHAKGAKARAQLMKKRRAAPATLPVDRKAVLAAALARKRKA